MPLDKGRPPAKAELDIADQATSQLALAEVYLPVLGFFSGEACLADSWMVSSADFCISSVLMVICTKVRFILSQFSTASSSRIFFCTSSTLMVGWNIPGMGKDIGFHIFWKNSNNSLDESSAIACSRKAVTT